MQISTGRREKRIARALELTGHQSDGEGLPEGTFTDNVSTRGARIVTTCKLEPGGTIELHSLGNEFQLHGRVVYCQALFGGQFAAGVELQIQNFQETPNATKWNLL